MNEPANERMCECGRPAKMAADPMYAVEFDEAMNEYHVVRDGARALMRYCFWCGGRLPESKRGTFFTTPSKEEMNEVCSLLTDAKSLEDVFRILGRPDETRDAKGSFGGPGKPIHIRWEKVHWYSTRWKSLVLQVPDLPDGHRYKSFRAHFLGTPADEPEKRGS